MQKREPFLHRVRTNIKTHDAKVKIDKKDTLIEARSRYYSLICEGGSSLVREDKCTLYRT